MPAAVLSRLSANHVDREVGRVVYTQWLYPSGGIAADLTVTRLAEERFLVVTSDLIQRRVEPMVRRATGPDEHCTVTDVTSGTVAAVGPGPAFPGAPRPLVVGRSVQRGVPLPVGPDDRRRPRPGAGPAGDLSRGAGLRAARPHRVRAGVYDALMEAGADLGVRPVGLAAMAGLRLEKGYRDLGVDIDNTDNPLEAGLGFAVAFDKPGGFIGREALLTLRDPAPYRSLLVSLLVEDPDVDLFGNEPVLLDGSWIGYVRAAAYGHTLGGAVGLAMVDHPDGVTPEWLDSGRFEVWTPAGKPARSAVGRPALRPGSQPDPGPGGLVSTASAPAAGDRRFVLTVTCPDPTGIVAAVTGFIAEHGGWVVEAAQHGDLGTGRFFQRIEVLAESLPFGPDEFAEALRRRGQRSSNSTGTCATRSVRRTGGDPGQQGGPLPGRPAPSVAQAAICRRTSRWSSPTIPTSGRSSNGTASSSGTSRSPPAARPRPSPRLRPCSTPSAGT